MSNAQSSRLVPRNLGVMLLGACALWLVVQNTVLVVGLVWARQAQVVTLVEALTKTTAVLILGFWSSPAAGWLVGVAAGVTLGALIPYVRQEVVRHG